MATCQVSRSKLVAQAEPHTQPQPGPTGRGEAAGHQPSDSPPPPTEAEGGKRQALRSPGVLLQIPAREAALAPPNSCRDQGPLQPCSP